MSNLEGDLPEKFSNTHLTRGQNAQTGNATYDVIVRLARPEYRPPYMRMLKHFSPGFMRAQIDFADFPQADADRDVITVELRAYQSLDTETLQ